jgi:hypothetical protein
MEPINLHYLQSINNVELNLISIGYFRIYSELEHATLSKTGFYCIRLKANSNLPNKYQNILDQRNSRILYIGKAEDQSLRFRLGQEIEHKRAGTFFRSIGCVLNYLPIPGHLKGKSNQNNYKFSPSHTIEIVKWLKSNVEISIVAYAGNFDIEKELIAKYRPLLNDTHNPMSLQELKEDRAKCRKIARGL